MASNSYRGAALLNTSNRFATLQLLDDDAAGEDLPVNSPQAVAISTIPRGPLQNPRRRQQKASQTVIHILCAVCGSIFNSSPDFDQFRETEAYRDHYTRDLFLKAVKAGCYICLLLKDKITALGYTIENAVKAFNRSTFAFELLSYRITVEEVEHYLVFECRAEKVLKLQMLPIEVLNLSIGPWVGSSSTGAGENIGLARRWLQQCRSQHYKCGHHHRSQSTLPTRLIQIERTGKHNTFRLCHGKDLPSSTPYLTLSHCWGQQPIYTLLSSNIELLHQRINLSVLPKVFQDALFLTETLGFQYLWIDSLCIIQDSKNDWLSEAPLMGEVYKNATCNIAATGFIDGRAGLFATRDMRPLVPMKTFVNWDGERPDNKGSLRGHYYLIDDDFWDFAVSSAPLNLRAWVVQERLLSPCIIHFGAKQLLWECCELRANETFHLGFDYRISGQQLKNWSFQILSSQESSKQYPTGEGALSWPATQSLKSLREYRPTKLEYKPRDLYYFWHEIIETYTKGQLTFAQDKLPAVSGVAKELWNLLGNRYIAGMWEGDLIRSLLWKISYSSKNTTLPVMYRAPTWSWASLDSEINFGLAFRADTYSRGIHTYPKEVIHSKILEVYITPLTKDYFSIIVDGCLRIRGPLRQAVRKESQWSSFTKWVVSDGLVHLQIVSDIAMQKKENLETTDIRPLDSPFRRYPLSCEDMLRVYLLPIRSDQESYDLRFELYGLVLCPTGRKRGEFHRVGVFTVPEQEDQKVILRPSHAIREELYEKFEDDGLYTVTIV